MTEEPTTHEAYEVEIWRDRATGKIVTELWNRPAVPIEINGKQYPEVGNRLHRVGGPAMVRYDPTTEVATEELWYKNGRIHRDDGPAKIHRDALTGKIKSSSWFREGQRIVRSERPPLRGRTPPLRQGPK